jgi:hypothetical protein
MNKSLRIWPYSRSVFALTRAVKKLPQLTLSILVLSVNLVELVCFQPIPLGATTATATASAHDAKGRFAPGNSGGPGNPFAWHCANFRKILLTTVTIEDIQQIAQALIAKAKEGNLQAARLLLPYHPRQAIRQSARGPFCRCRRRGGAKVETPRQPTEKNAAGPRQRRRHLPSRTNNVKSAVPVRFHGGYALVWRQYFAQ